MVILVSKEALGPQESIKGFLPSKEQSEKILGWEKFITIGQVQGTVKIENFMQMGVPCI